MAIKFIIPFAFILLFSSFSQFHRNPFDSQKKDTLFALKYQGNNLNVYLKVPEKKIIGTIVLLPGWKLPVMDWCTRTELCNKALDQGYILIMPEMSKSIYANEIYPETRKDWLLYATRKWFVDSLIGYFQTQHNLLLPGQKNYILGLSTGARGAALLCLDCPGVFKKGAGLSGDYDQTRMQQDALMTGFYGPCNQYKDRWTGKDNIVYRFNELQIPLYLGHGKADKVVPANQTIQFADSLKKYKPKLIICHINDTAGHNYGYWRSEVDNVLRFFSTN